ncbi:hypothetical protein PYCCODRAFT_617575 [Trametes coccinea BRFM310]|uniref:Uncharacterized protein n=1 Tax=Trametes coccinea (strain BRFM310) TaxID=1353009 RepID=A0A1Y2J242_TRAC3|nr:hypothetical protein PYCCODRAFT_617575 [Trametes coccinea BRFM310]
MASSVSQSTASHLLAETTSSPIPTQTPTQTETHRFTLTVTSPPGETDEGTRREPAAPEEPPRPQAGPLPRKRGEIGFIEGLHDRGDVHAQASASVTSLPAHHPADRDAPPSIDAPGAPAPSGAAPSNTGASASTGDAPPRSPSPNGSTDTAGKRSFISLLKPKRIPTFGGLRLTSLAIFAFQVCLFAGTVAGWALLAIHMQHAGNSSDSSSPPPPPPNSSSGSDDTSTAVLSQTSAQIFIHVAFGLTSLAELIFLERSIFRLRAERYAYKHPGEILPRSRGTRPSQEGSSTAMAFAPWNRPPLPTYAAALAQSGVGTGDVEDNIIAIPPPPAYGHTRGSTLLLAGFMSDALRAQRPRDSTGSTASRASRASRVRSWLGGARAEEGEEGDRPKSYMSTDPEWEELRDASTALQLEETLARLEEGGGRPGTRSS